MTKTYPLKIENIGEDVYTLMSRGHHDIHAFMRAVRSGGYHWPLGIPEHLWFHASPAAPGSGYICHYSQCDPGTRGAFPVTVVTEACGEDRYEAKSPSASAV